MILDANTEATMTERDRRSPARPTGAARGAGVHLAGGLLAMMLALIPGCTGGGNPVAGEVAAAEVPAEHTDGKRLFDTYCARCHGVHAAGTGRGPSFLSKIYESSHHGDEAFMLAVRRGVSAHHWGFGNMPPVPGVAEEDVSKIIGYIRWAQHVAGIS
jgi:mono/diheme cytochrome c family protein